MTRFATLKKPPQNIGLERAVKKVKSREQDKKLAFPHPHKEIFSYKIRGEKPFVYPVFILPTNSIAVIQ